ncbi:nesprin-4 isoform X1 [Mustela lutreola]|uniref:Nesprin-4 isoform X1 n=1 Tax=Mustela putorius furo TaxID=9669 RepID=A0A8U0RZJ9_MUSPF|nr:nesprin-4 isoform X1 [Mustela putorius furo]XP_059007303.1 nesprin-4 isoform X1 [Mustela lutreola]
MALPPPLGPRPPSEPLNHPPGAPREPDIGGFTLCPASEERLRPDQAQKLGQDSLDPPQHLQGGLGGTEPAAGPLRLPAPTSSEDAAAAKHCEHLSSGQEVLEAEQDSLALCLLGLGLRLRDLERGLGPWASAQSRMGQLQALQADLRGAAERIDALLAFGEGLAQRSEPQARASLEQVLRALRAHRSSIFRRLWWLQAQLVSSSLVWPALAVPAPGTDSTAPITLSSDQVFEEASPLDQDLEVEGDLDGPGPGGIWGPWTPSSYPTPAELEWDPAGDVGGLRPLWQKTAWTPGAPCELCGHRGPQGRGQGLEFSQGPHTSVSPQDMLMSGFSHWKHLAGQRRRSLLRKSQDKKRASPNLQGVMLEVDPGAPPPASGHSLILLLLLLFLLLVGATLLLPPSGGSCCSSARLAGTPYLVLSYVNGPPPI